MTTDNSSSFPVQRAHWQYNYMQSAQTLGGGLDDELCSSGHLPGTNSAGLYGPHSAMNYVNAFPPTGYTGNMGYDDSPHLETVPAQQGNQSQLQLDGHRTPGNTQHIPIAPGPPWLEQYAPAFPLQEVPNDCPPPSHGPLPHNIAGPSRGNPRLVHPGMPAAEDLKNLAGHYLQNPGSRIDKFRIKRSRSGAVKVLISLEIDDTM